VTYTPAEVRALTPVRDSVEKRTPLPDPRDVFLCHAWDDRSGAAKELHDLLESLGVSEDHGVVFAFLPFSGVIKKKGFADCAGEMDPRHDALGKVEQLGSGHVL